MKNKILVQICDKEYSIITEEPEEYVHKLSAEITKMVDATAYKNLRTSKLDAALITCLELCNKNNKLSEDNDNMRREILEYIDDIGKLNKKLTALERQKPAKKPAAQEIKEPQETETQEENGAENTEDADDTEDTEYTGNSGAESEPEVLDDEEESFTPNTPVYRKF
ncbi:MAG: cell division protein ZapA [Oscillospiraceae bacterium]|nr:cell division protein ZapA [Oscillospiraceae bacterium]